MTTLDFTGMMKLKKIDLIRLISKLSEERDILFDETETLKEEVRDLESQVSSDYDNEQLIDEAKDIIERIKASKWKLDLGVMSEADEITKLTERLENIFA
jgi:uncharacterized coiled-coil DUF342 family protein